MKTLNIVVLCVVAVIMALVATSEAAQCSVVSDCSMLATSFTEWWGLISPSKKAAFVLFFTSLFGGIYIMWHDRKVTAARIKQEEQEWIRKYHS